MRMILDARFRSACLLKLTGSLVCAHATLLGCSPSDSGTQPMGNGGAISTSGGATASSSGGATGGAAQGGQTSLGGAPSNGGSGSGGATITGGSTNTGGATGGSPNGAMQGGASATSGGKSNSDTGGMAGASKGGAQSGGGTGTAGSAGSGGVTGGTKVPPNPSAGCGKSNPATGTSGSPLNVSNHQYYVKLPTGYDANKPYPVLIIFNPTNNPISWAEQSAGYEQLSAKSEAIRVYPHPQNSSSGWGAGDVSFFKPLYDKITDSYCIDKARVFAGGESSGGDFSSIIGCEHANLLRAIAPCATKDVSQYPLDANKRKCTGQVTAIVIHGKNDNVVGPANGPKTRDFYVALNHCGTMTQPVTGYTDTKSNCVQYQGCDANFPVYWCQHTDPNYSETNHGWPAFAAKMTWGVFSSY